MDPFKKMMITRRKELGLSQGDVAEKLGHGSHVTVQRWEAAKPDREVEIEEIPAWAEAIGIPSRVAVMAWITSRTGIEGPLSAGPLVLSPGLDVALLGSSGEQGEPLILDENILAALDAMAKIKKRGEADGND